MNIATIICLQKVEPHVNHRSTICNVFLLFLWESCLKYCCLKMDVEVHRLLTVACTKELFLIDSSEAFPSKLQENL